MRSPVYAVLLGCFGAPASAQNTTGGEATSGVTLPDRDNAPTTALPGVVAPPALTLHECQTKALTKAQKRSCCDGYKEMRKHCR